MLDSHMAFIFNPTTRRWLEGSFTKLNSSLEYRWVGDQLPLKFSGVMEQIADAPMMLLGANDAHDQFGVADLTVLDDKTPQRFRLVHDFSMLDGQFHDWESAKKEVIKVHYSYILSESE
jgi:hypothetical protein